jgi:hypothetical protein
MQKMYPHTNPAPVGASENWNVIPAAQIEEALRESVSQNAAHIRRDSFSGLPPSRWASWMTRSWTSGGYEISCTARANEYKGKSPAICSSPTLRSAQQVVLPITSCNGKGRRTSEAISWAQRLRRRPRPPPKLSLSRRNDLGPRWGYGLGILDDSTISPA